MQGYSSCCINIVGNGCACEDGYDAQYSNSGELRACVVQAPVVLQDSATAVSGTWTVIPVLANDAGNTKRIQAVSRRVSGGRVVIVANATAGADVIKYLSKDGFIGQDAFNYTTADGTGIVTVDVTPGSCEGSKCGVLGSCSAGRCSCAADSGMLPHLWSTPTPLHMLLPQRSLPAATQVGADVASVSASVMRTQLCSAAADGVCKIDVQVLSPNVHAQ
jgi:hypothetical protein